MAGGTRYAKLTIVIGERGGGKTNETLRLLYEAAKKRKVLIFDAQNEFDNYLYRPGQPHHIDAIFFRDIPWFTLQPIPQIRRTTDRLDNGDVMTSDEMQEQLISVLKTFRNGILLIEDINAFVADNAPNGIYGALATLRQKGVDVIVHYQLVQKAANPKLLGFANYIRLHKTGVSVEQYRDKFGDDKTNILILAEYIVERRYNNGLKKGIFSDEGKFFSCLIDLNNRKIHGIFSKKEAIAAIERYISDNSRKTIDAELRKVKRDGSYVWAGKTEGERREKAYKYLEEKFLSDYFVFKDTEPKPDKKESDNELPNLTNTRHSIKN